MDRKIALAILTLGLLAVGTQADMTYAPFMIGGALDASGTAISNGTYVMVLDLDGDGWQGTSYTSASSGLDNASSWLWDADDLLMDRGQIIDGEAYPFSTLATSQLPATYTANVDHYYILWFDVAYDATATGPGAGVSYGAEDLGTVGTDPGDYNVFPVGGNASLTTSSGPVPSWHNGTLAGDVNGDGAVTAEDALLLIDKINADGSHALQLPDDPLPVEGEGLFWDVSDDAVPYLSPLDALIVINELNGADLQVATAAFNSMNNVPEPASLALLSLGGAWLLGARRRTRKAA